MIETATELPLSRRALRELLRCAYVTVGQFEAFCQSYFPGTARRMPSAYELLERENLLFAVEPPERILAALLQDRPDAIAEHLPECRARFPPPAAPVPGLDLPTGIALSAIDEAALRSLTFEQLEAAFAPLAAMPVVERMSRSVQFLRRSGGRLAVLGALWSRIRTVETVDLAQPLSPRLLQAAGLAAARPLPATDWRQVGGQELVASFHILRTPFTYGRFANSFPSLRLDQSIADEAVELPIVQISQPEAEVIAELLGGQLPQVFHLELAGWWDRAGRVRRFPWGDRQDPKRSNCLERGRGATCSVKLHRGLGTSDWDVDDLAGNVWEWTCTEGSYDPARVLVKGGSYLTLQRAAERSMNDEYVPSRPVSFIGFRLVKTL